MRRSFSLTLLGVLLVSLSLSAQKMTSPAAFMNAFSAAIKKDDFGSLEQLVRQNKDLVWPAFRFYEVEWCVQSLKDGEQEKQHFEQMDMTIEQLAQVNNVAEHNATLVQRVAWLRSLTPEQKKAKIKLNALAIKAGPLYAAASKSRGEEQVKKVVPLYQQVVALAHTAGDAFEGANACFFLAYLYDFIPSPFETCYYYKLGDTVGRNAGHARSLVEAFNLAAKLRIAADRGHIKADLIDVSKPLLEAKAAYKKALEQAVAGGGTPAAAGGSGRGAGKGSAAKPVANKVGWAMPPLPIDRKAAPKWLEEKGFKVKKESHPDKVASCYVVGRGNWLNWSAVQIKKGETRAFPFLPGGFKVENDGGKIFLLRPGKKHSKQRLKIGARPKLLSFKKVKYTDGSLGTVYLSMMKQPTEYTLFGVQFNAAGTAVVLRIQGGSMLKGKARGINFAIYDSNANGAFNDWGIDTVFVGKGRRAVPMPLSKYLNLGGTMYELKVDASGKIIKTKPYDGEMAPLKVEYKANIMPSFLVASGSGARATYFVNLLDALDKPIWVLPGVMQIAHGYILKGKGTKAKSIFIGKGRSGGFKIQPGQKNIWKLGGVGRGFSFQFTAQTSRKRGEEHVTVAGKDIKVYGAFGELYSRFQFGHPMPIVSFRKGKTGARWPKKYKMRRAEREDYAQDSNLIWYPKPLVVKKGSSGDYSVMMECDYAPLGHIRSDWLAGN